MTTYDTIDNPYGDDLLRDSNVVGDASLLDASGADYTAQTTDTITSNDLDNLWITSWIKSRSYRPKSHGFYLDGLTGYVECTSLYVGAGGIVGGKIDIPDADTANSFHVDAEGNLWIGATTFGAAPFSVSKSGDLIATSATIDGVSISRQHIFGDGSDGSATISSNTSLTEDMFYNDLTIDSGFTLNTNGYRVFVKGTLTNNGTIGRPGNDGAAGEYGVAGANFEAERALGGAGGAVLAPGTLGGAEAGGDGGNGGLTDGNGTDAVEGTNASACVTESASPSGDGGSGGQGGDGSTPGSGGDPGDSKVAGTSTLAASYKPRTVVFAQQMIDVGTADRLVGGAGASSGSGGGGGGNGTGGSGTPGGGGGGGGGAGGAGGVVSISANTVVNTGTITAKGGNGGDGGDGGNGSFGNNIGEGGGGGGGGGGNGGILALIYADLTNTGTITAAGGTGGAGGLAGDPAGQTANGADGDDGEDGIPGALIQLEL